MVLDNIIYRIVGNRVKKIRKELGNLNIKKIRRDIYKINEKQIDLIKRYNAVTILRYCAKNSPQYKEQLNKIINTINFNNVFSKITEMPFTTPVELNQNPKQFLAVPESEIKTYHFTYGSTGKKKLIYLSKHDLNLINYMYVLGFIHAGVKEDDIAQIVHSYGIWQLAETMQMALSTLGVICLPIGFYVSFEEQQRFMEEFNVTLLFGNPSYVFNLAKELKLSADVKERMRRIFVAGESLPKHRRKFIEKNLGGEVYLSYGLMEVGGGIGSECKYHNGYHVFPNVYCEIINPKTGLLVENGEYGELVITTLGRQAMPLIRYRTGDITRILNDKCDCGLNLPMIDHIIGRADDRVIIGTAEKYFPRNFDEVIDQIDEVKDYWIEITKQDDQDQLSVYIITDEPSDELKVKIQEKLLAIDTLKMDTEVSKTVNYPEIIFLKDFPDKKEKRQRLIDKRNDYK
ncbi:MAG: phenylacetate--CoA ligase family protein [Asgard group archaeon]|nr:phenylacetate--CoA ligase family protein [Asgard group archaeon]